MLIHTWPGPAREMRGYNGAGGRAPSEIQGKAPDGQGPEAVSFF